jgi:hypothetical protein
MLIDRDFVSISGRSDSHQPNRDFLGFLAVGCRAAAISGKISSKYAIL